MLPVRAVAAAAPPAGGAAPPVHLTRLVGREREVAEVRRLLAGERLVTLTGAGGVGKTRLALAVAAGAEPFADAVVWVDFAEVAEPEIVAQHVAAGCGVWDGAAASAEELLLGALGPTSLLLVLDNCEHLVDACAHLVDRLLKSCPRLRVLATSREALGIAGEQAWLVPPLALPPEGAATTAGDLLSTAAAELFVERARAARPGFEIGDADAAAVAQICRRLDGLPLALELAAARVKVLALAELAERLDDAFALLTAGARTAPLRHRTLRATLDWSYRLLSDPERAVLRRLSVFRGGFDLAAAEAVAAGEDVERAAVLDLLAALVDRSLVGVESGRGRARYRLLETVRRYGAERLAEAEEREAARRRHARHYLELAEEVEPAIFGGGDEGAMRRLDDEIADLRAAFEHAAADPEGPALALRLAYALHWYWFARGHFREGRQRLTAALGAAGEDAAPELRARALAALARVALWQGDAAGVREAAERAMAALPADAAGDTRGYAVHALGLAQCLDGDHAAAVRSFQAAAEAAEAAEAALPVLVSLTCSWQAESQLALGDLDGARAGLERALEIGRRLAHPAAIGHPLSLLGRTHELAGDEAAAAACWREALAVHAAVDDRWGLQQAFEGMARRALAAGDPARAARLLGCADAAREGLGSLLLPDDERRHRAAAETAREALGEGGFEAEWAAGRALPRAEAVALARGDEGAEVPAERAADDVASGGSVAGSAGAVVPAGDVPAVARTPAVTRTGGSALEVRALGPFEVWRDGELLAGEVWGASKPRELLLFLLSRPQGVGREQIGLALWPEASPAQLRNSFHVTLHRLRRALGDADLVAVAGDRYTAAPALVSRFDAARFEAAAAAELAAPDASRDGLGGLADALALYRGDLLAGEALSGWCLDWRERLAQLRRRLLRFQGERLLAAGRADEAATALAALLAADPLDEEACRELMLCEVRLHRRSQALRLYRQLAERLEKELGADPDPATTDLFERLQLGERA